MKIAINKCYGGFGLSPKAIELYLKKLGKKCYFYKQTKYKHNGGIDEYKQLSLKEAEDSFFVYIYTKDMGKTFFKWNDKYYWSSHFDYEKRTDKILIEIIEELGEDEASGRLADIHIVEIPDDTEWEIDEYDGIESIHEKHRSW